MLGIPNHWAAISHLPNQQYKRTLDLVEMSSDSDFKAEAAQKTDHVSPTIETFDEIEEKKLIRKIDWRLLPILGALYSISFIDRGNVRYVVLARRGGFADNF